MVNDEFKVASKDDELQKAQREDQDRVRKIDGIKDIQNKRSAFTMMSERDHDMKIMKEQNKAQRDRMVDEQERKIRPNAEMHLKPKYAPAESVESRRKHIQKTIDSTVGKEHRKQENGYLKTRNSQIDKFISVSHKKDRDAAERKGSVKHSEFAANAKDVTNQRGTDETTQDHKDRNTMTADQERTSRTTTRKTARQAASERATARASRSKGRGGHAR